MITFLCGLESDNKTRLFVERVKQSAQAKRQITVIVPEQQAVVWERRLARALSPEAALCLDVVSFTRLANLVERRYGGLAYSLAGRAERYLLMWRAIKNVAPLLRVYGDKSDPASIVPAMQDVQSELERSGVTPEALNAAAAELEAENGASPLADRMRDVAMISAEYKASFEGRFDDPADESEKLLSLLREHDFFAGRDVFIDSFYSLTAVESAVVREIFSQADNVTMTFACPSKKVADAPHLEHIRKFFTRLCAFCDPQIIDVEPKSGKDRQSVERSILRDSLWDFTADNAEKLPGEPYVRTVRLCDRYDEAEYAVARVEQLVREGARYSEIAVIARSAEPYTGIIDAAFADAGIPLSMSMRFRLASSPVVTLALSILGAVRSRFARDEIVAMLSTGLTSLTDEEVSSLSRYTDVWSIDSRAAWRVEEWTMSPDGYSDRRSDRAIRELALANSAKSKVEDILAPVEDAFASAPTVREACAALWRCVERARAYEKLCERAASLDALGFRDAANFIGASYGELAGCLDSLVTVLGDETTDASSFAALLRRLVAERDVGVIPAGIDEVTFGAADRLRADRLSHVIILGATDGVFPRTPGESSIFTDSDRVQMEGAGIVLSDDADSRAGAELFWFWRAACAAERSLDVVVPESDGSAKCEPSSGARRIRALFPHAPEIYFSPDDALAALWSRRLASRFASVGGDGDGDGDASGNAFSAKEVAEALCALGIAADCASGESVWDSIPADLAERVFGKELRLSQTRLESFVKCAMMYYGRYVLDLDDRSENRVAPVDVGNFIHSVLEKYFKAADVRALSDEENAALIERLSADYVSSIFGDEPTPRVRYLTQRITKSIALISQMLRREFQSSRFEPFAMEQPIGTGEGAVPPTVIDLGGGRSVSLRGVIDRLDVYRRGEDAFVRVVDYKTGSKRLEDADLALGLNTQMLLYLFAICSSPEGEFRRRLCEGASNVRPAGVMYFSAAPGAASSAVAVEGEEAEKKAEASVVRSGRFLADDDVLGAMDPEGNGEFIPVKRLKDGSFSKTSVLSEEQFGELRSAVESKIASVAADMLAGRSDALPLSHHSLPCDYCALLPVCRNTDGKCRYE